MIVAWMGYAMLCAAAVGACAACIDRMLAHQRYARRFIWMGAMATSAVLPAGLSLIAPPIASHATPRSATIESTAPATTSFDLDDTALALWVLATLAAATWLVISQARLRRSLSRRDRACIDGVVVVVSPDFGPAVVGVVRPEIVLPSWVLSLGDTDRRLVLAHEREHMHGRDPFWQLAGLALVVTTPWNLALWWQLKRLRLAIEIDCDARVVERHHVHPARYGELLVRAHASAPPSMAASSLALLQSKSTLARRVDALLGLPRPSTRRIALSSGFGVVFAGVVTVTPAPAFRHAPAARTIAPSRVAFHEPRAAAPSVAPTPRPSSSTAERAARRTITTARALPQGAIPPVHVTPSVSSAMAFASPAVAPLPARRLGGAVLVPRGSFGFARAAGSDTSTARAGGFVARPAVVVPAGSDTAARASTGPTAARGGVVRAAAKPPTP